MIARIVVLIASLAINAMATDYFVRKDGSDAASGLNNTTDPASGAWLTLSKANTVAQPGDTIYLGAGSWGGEGSINTARNGTSGNPIVWVGSGKDVTYVSKFEVDNHYIHIKEMTVGWQIDIRYVDYTLVENVKFTWTGGRQYWVQPENNFTESTGHIARGCDFIGCGTAAAVSLNGVDSLIENCYFTSSNGGDAIYLNGFRNTIRGCRFIDWDLPAGSTQHTDIFQSFRSGSGTGNEQSQDHIIENNIIADCNGCQIGNIDWPGEPQTIKNWTFRNNVFARVTNPLNLMAEGFKFYNNTFYKCGYPGSGSGPILLINYPPPEPDARGDARNTEFYNNIWYQCGTNPFSNDQGWWGYGGGSISTIYLNNNLVIGIGAGQTKGSRWTQFYNAVGAGWGTGNNDSINGQDPLFIPAAATGQTVADYALQASSPAIGEGKVLDGFTTDAVGTTRGVAWDIGAVEFSSDPADVTAPTLTTAIIDSTGALLTLTFSENVTSVSAAHYSLSAGNTLGGVEEIGPVVTMTISPAVISGEVVTLSYTSGAGRTADAAGNLLATFSGAAVDNQSLETTPDPPRAAGRGAAARRVLR